MKIKVGFSNSINKKYPFTLVDVGAMGGVSKKWDVLPDGVKIIAFEPDPREFEKLKSTENVTYFNNVLHSKSEDLSFYITKSSGKSSLFKPNKKVLSQFDDVDRFEVVGQVPVSAQRVKSLDIVIDENGIEDLDFIKIDTQGSELSILEGSKASALSKVFALQIEVEFLRLYENQPLFRDVDLFMDQHGFQLMDIRRFYWKRKNRFEFSGKGQLIFGDALYVKKLGDLAQDLSKQKASEYGLSKVLKSILICLVYKMFDYALDLVLVALELNYLDKKDYEEIVGEIKRNYNENCNDFPGKDSLAKVVLVLSEKLKMSSYLGWADSDRMICNIRDL